MCQSLSSYKLLDSHPNRGLQNRDVLERLLDGVTKARDELSPSTLTFRKPKLVLKIAPDLNESQLADVADVIRNSSIDGVIVSNTTVQRPKSLVNRTLFTCRHAIRKSHWPIANKSEMGGLSGPPIKPLSLKALRILRGHLPASTPLIGCGGISTGADALEFAKAGASMVQVYTGFGYDGVGACRRIKDQLVDELGREGKTWSEVVNEAVAKLSLKEVEKPTEIDQTSAISLLIAEAHELKTMLDNFGDKMGEQDAISIGKENGLAATAEAAADTK